MTKEKGVSGKGAWVATGAPAAWVHRLRGDVTAWPLVAPPAASCLPRAWAARTRSGGRVLPSRCASVATTAAVVAVAGAATAVVDSWLADVPACPAPVFLSGRVMTEAVAWTVEQATPAETLVERGAVATAVAAADAAATTAGGTAKSVSRRYHEALLSLLPSTRVPAAAAAVPASDGSHTPLGAAGGREGFLAVAGEEGVARTLAVRGRRATAGSGGAGAGGGGGATKAASGAGGARRTSGRTGALLGEGQVADAAADAGNSDREWEGTSEAASCCVVGVNVGWPCAKWRTDWSGGEVMVTTAAIGERPTVARRRRAWSELADGGGKADWFGGEKDVVLGALL